MKSIVKLSCRCLSRRHIVGQVLRSQDKRTASEQKTCNSLCIRWLSFTDEAQREKVVLDAASQFLVLPLHLPKV